MRIFETDVQKIKYKVLRAVAEHALNEKMEEFVLEADDFLARAICHECDHLHGHLYVELVEGPLEDVAAEEE